MQGERAFDFGNGRVALRGKSPSALAMPKANIFGTLVAITDL
jgi:hypothetical protein